MLNKNELLELLNEIGSDLSDVYFAEEIYVITQMSNYFDAANIKDHIENFTALTQHIINSQDHLNTKVSFTELANNFFSHIEVEGMDLREFLALDYTKVKDIIRSGIYENKSN